MTLPIASRCPRLRATWATGVDTITNSDTAHLTRSSISNRSHTAMRIRLDTMGWRGAIVLAVLIVVVGITAFRQVNSNARSINARLSRFDTLLTLLHDYDFNTGRLPPAVKYDESGKCLYSWRFALVRFWEDVKDLVDMEASWNSPSNQHFSARDIELYCSADERNTAKRMKGTVSVIVGRDTPMQLKSSSRLSEVPGDTILIIEAAPDAIHWMAPGDIPLNPDDELEHSGKGIVVGFADGQIWYLRDSVPTRVLMRFATVKPGELRDREALLGPYRVRVTRARMFDVYSRVTPKRL